MACICSSLQAWYCLILIQTISWCLLLTGFLQCTRTAKICAPLCCIFICSRMCTTKMITATLAPREVSISSDPISIRNLAHPLLRSAVKFAPFLLWIRSVLCCNFFSTWTDQSLSLSLALTSISFTAPTQNFGLLLLNRLGFLHKVLSPSKYVQKFQRYHSWKKSPWECCKCFRTCKIHIYLHLAWFHNPKERDNYPRWHWARFYNFWE